MSTLTRGLDALAGDGSLPDDAADRAWRTAAGFRRRRRATCGVALTITAAAAVAASALAGGTSGSGEQLAAPPTEAAPQSSPSTAVAPADADAALRDAPWFRLEKQLTEPGRPSNSIVVWNSREGSEVVKVDTGAPEVSAAGSGDPAFGVGFQRAQDLPSAPAALRAVLESAGSPSTGETAVYRHAGALLLGPVTRDVRVSLLGLMRELAGDQVGTAVDSRGRTGVSLPDPAVFGSSIPTKSTLIVDSVTARPLERAMHQDALPGQPLISRETYLSFSTQPPPAPYDR